jgi:glycosyltransferase involved in cell wall biosynthesis
MLSVAIPAHNEGAVIVRCLRAIFTGIDSALIDVVVVCNGCTDNTAEMARSFNNVRVYELDKPSKVNAINFADSVLTTFPRVYVDADLIITGRDLLKVAEYLRQPDVYAVAPYMIIDDSHSSLCVKAYHRIWTRLPYYKTRLGGVFGLSEKARERFSKFPDIIADDAYVRAHFTSNERLVPDDCSFLAMAPKKLSELIKIKTRSRFGNVELNQKFPELSFNTDNQPDSLIKLIVKQPWLLPSVLVYVYVKIKVIQGVKKRLKNKDYTTWERDESSRSISE